MTNEHQEAGHSTTDQTLEVVYTNMFLGISGSSPCRHDTTVMSNTPFQEYVNSVRPLLHNDEFQD